VDVPQADVTADVATRFLGVTVLPMYFQSEGVDAVLDALASVGVNAIATAPSVYEAIDRLPGADEAGLSDELPRREPPIDAGAGVGRTVERRLWGHEQVLINPSPSMPPDPRQYAGLRYQPARATALTDAEGGMIARIIDGAHARGMKVYFQLSAVQVPGRHEDDLPRLPDGSFPRQRMVQTAAVASDHVRAYTCARTRDLLTSYPNVDGLRFDWPEHPPYTLGDAFLDFSEHARRMAPRLGFEFEPMRLAAEALYERLGDLRHADLDLCARPRELPYALARLVGREAALLDIVRFKAALTTNYLAELRAAMDSVPGGSTKELSPNAFPPPLSLLSGVDYGAVSEIVDSISVKLYTMHWPQIVHYYAEELMANNARPLDPVRVLKAVSTLFDLEDGEPGTSLEDYRYPLPHEAHRAGADAQRRKIRQATTASAGRATVYPAVHGYGPSDDFETRLRLAWETSTAGIWVNRYCYLGDAKIEAIGRLT
jgi:hypothetical protein